MSIIVFSAKEMVIIADQFIFDVKKHKGGIVEPKYVIGEKVHITDDNHFAYCFEHEQCQEAIPVLTSYLIRHEMGLLTDEDKPPIFEGKEFEVGIMSKRTMYRIASQKEKDEYTTAIFISEKVWTNFYHSSHLFEVLNLPAGVIWEEMRKLQVVSHTQIPTIVTNKSLALIKKPAKKKTIKENN